MGSYKMERDKNNKESKKPSQEHVTETYNDITKSTIPGAFQTQNIGHNSKKEGLGPNTIR